MIKHLQYFFFFYYKDVILKECSDYIIKTTDRNIWIIETKGGMQAGHTKNIDRQVENKFNAFKKYAKKYNLHWGFVRDIDEELYINNTIYTENMSEDN